MTKKRRIHVPGARRGFIPFSALSAHKRRDAFIRLRWRISRNRTKYGGEFRPTTVLDEPGRPTIFDQDMHFYFLGLDGRTIWNCYLQTGNREYWGLVSERAHEEVERIAPSRRERSNWSDLFIPKYDTAGRLKYYTMKPEEGDPRLGNQTASQYRDELESKMIQEDMNGAFPVFEEWTIDRRFEYGIGIYATIDAPFIDRTVMQTFIERFRAHGEIPWKSTTPVPRERLPMKSFEQIAKATQGV